MATELDEEHDESSANTPTAAGPNPSTPRRQRADTQTSVKTEETADTEEEDDEEPRLKYSRLTGNLAGCYRSDSTSSFLVAGDKMIIGSHNGNINILTIPSFQPLKSYRAHSAAVTTVSISPFPPPWPTAQSVVTSRLRAEEPTNSPGRAPSITSGAEASPRAPRLQPQIPATPSNSIFVATSSQDGLVCVQSLVDAKDVTLRNFARPLNSVALSPEYKSDRTYISGGLAGSLILTVGGRTGVKENANTNSAAAAASGWLGSMGIGSNTGKDTVLHSGEGAINSIKWSLSGKFVAWVNEQGIKIMRSNLKLDSAETDYAWKRIAHIDRPNRKNWAEMASSWMARMDWIDDKQLETDEDEPGNHTNGSTSVSASAASESLKHTKGLSRRKRIERLVVGWGDSAWVLHVSPEGAGPTKGKDASERVGGSATIVHHLLFDDCIISGLSLYTPSLLLVLAYRTRDDNDKPLAVSVEKSPRRGVHHRQNGLSPELRIINVQTKEEADVDTLTMKNYESLSAADYHIGTLYVPAAPVIGPSQKGAFSVLTDGLWDVGSSLGGAARMFGSGASIRSSGSGENTVASPPATSINSKIAAPTPARRPEVHSSAATPGLKIFIHSPYDCVLAVKRDLADHLSWLLDHHSYKEAWELVDEHPEVVTAPNFESAPSIESGSVASTPSKQRESLQDFFADDAASQTTLSATRGQNGVVDREKRRIGELWLQQLVQKQDWITAGQVAGRVLGLSSRWQHWIFTFAKAGRFDEITPYIPPTPLKPPIESLAYEVILGHYIHRNRLRLKELLDSWDTDLFSVNVVTSAIEERLERGDIKEATEVEAEGEGDWRILMDSLAKLYLADQRPKDALRCYIRLQNADAAMSLIREYHLLPAISDDLKGFILLRISKEQLQSAPLSELEENSSEATHLLVDEAYQGTVAPGMVVNQLSNDDEPDLLPFLFFYLRALWKGQGTEAMEKPKDEEDIPSRQKRERQQRQQRLEAEGRALVEDYGDLAVHLFAEYDRSLLMEFLRSSRSYAFEKASAECEKRQFWPELVYLLSQTGETKKALSLIINRLGDVSLAISFAKEQDDKELWDDLLNYSMDKPRFIRGLLEEVGTAIDPIKLVRRIPEGLEIEGLRDGVGRMVREYEIQASISDGVAEVLRSEVRAGMDALRKGRAKGVKFEVMHVEEPEEKGVEVSVNPIKPTEDQEASAAMPLQEDIKPDHEHDDGEVQPGHCAGCKALFVEDEKETLIGFACGHVYHLSCLLDRIRTTNPEVAEAAERVQNTFKNEPADEFSRSVGSKVAHAHVIRSVVSVGCVRCRDVVGEDDQ